MKLFGQTNFDKPGNNDNKQSTTAINTGQMKEDVHHINSCESWLLERNEEPCSIPTVLLLIFALCTSLTKA